MENTREQRAEKRLRYRWYARFASNQKQKSFSGQMVDVSSKGMALLYHADENCPKPNQSITTNFGVPYFDSGDSFDTVFFNRIGRVCRIDSLSSKVNRIAIRFAEPLFFKPGEQGIIDSDAKQRLEAKARLIAGTKEKAEAKVQTKVKTDNRVKSDTEESARLYIEALVRTEEKIRSYAEAKAQAEEKAKVEAKSRAKAEAKAKTEAMLRAKAEKKAETETLLRTEAEKKTETEALLRAEAGKKAETEAQKRAKIEAELREKAKSYAEQLVKVKEEAAREIAGIKNHSDDTIAKIKAEFKSRSHKEKSIPKKNTTKKATKMSDEGILMDKVDKFITDKNRIF